MKIGTKSSNLLILGTLTAIAVSVFAFKFVAAQKATLATKVSNFEAYMIEDVAFITWTTAVEKYGEEVTLERSTDGFTFHPVEQFQLNGKESKYTFVDNDPNYGLSYYRIKHDGHKTDNDIAPLINHAGPVDFKIEKGQNAIKLTADHKSDQTYLVSISDASGKHYFLQTMTFNSDSPVVINTGELGLESKEYLVHLHRNEWSADKRIFL